MTIEEAMKYAMCGKGIPYKKEVKKVFNDFIRFYDDSLNIYRDRVHELNCENEELEKENKKLKQAIENSETHISAKWRKIEEYDMCECSNCKGCEFYNHIGQYCRYCGAKINGWIKDHIADDSKTEGVRDESERND